MAEAAVVSALIDTFTGMVANKLSQEVSLIVNFRNDFEFFLKELFSIKCLLTDAGEKRSSSSVSDWLDNLEDFVADAEYLVEQCGAVDNIFDKVKFGRKIRKLRLRLEQIQRNAQNLHLLASKSQLDVTAHGQARDANGFNERRKRSYALLQEPQIVGMDDEIKVITQWILKEDSRPVIAVVGMGGQGKTLLLQHVFNSEEIRQHFHHRVWLPISQTFVVTELLRQVLREFEPKFDSKDLNEGELLNKIQKNLEGKRCLFAVDDVWDIYAWNDIGLPSRIEDKVVLTTRDEKIAKDLGAGDHILPKNSLSEENSWQLFCLHAFPDGAHRCPEALDEIARGIVKKCGGLPLAIKTIGAYLARSARGHPNDWEWTLNHLNEAHGMRDRVMPSLKLSYQALPSQLKLCFLYCSVFPKNTKIQSEYLVYAWIAQGFVSAKLEESYNVGRSYMDDLIDLCLIEVSEVGGDGRVRSCKMHDLLHDLAVSEQTKCLLKPGGKVKRIPAEECQGLRRISLMKNEISTIQNGIRCPGLRSLLLSHNRLTSISSSFF